MSRFRLIKEVLDEDGNGIVSDWIEKELSAAERARIDIRFNQIEANETENRNWLKPYVSLALWEIRVEAGNKAIRFLCHRLESDVILLIGCVKREQIKKAEEERAAERKAAFEKGILNVRDYPLPQRP